MLIKTTLGELREIEIKDEFQFKNERFVIHRPYTEQQFSLADKMAGFIPSCPKQTWVVSHHKTGVSIGLKNVCTTRKQAMADALELLISRQDILDEAIARFRVIN